MVLSAQLTLFLADRKEKKKKKDRGKNDYEGYIKEEKFPHHTRFMMSRLEETVVSEVDEIFFHLSRYYDSVLAEIAK